MPAEAEIYDYISDNKDDDLNKPPSFTASNYIHICVDMQKLFSPDGPWPLKDTDKVLPVIEAMTAQDPTRTIFTRFIPAAAPDAATGAWKHYYKKWRHVTQECLPPDKIELLDTFQRYTPPAQILDKSVYSPWSEASFDNLLSNMAAETLIITGGETDICVLATVFGAVDRGYRVVVVEDGVCGSNQNTHESALTLLRTRFSEQVSLSRSEDILTSMKST